MRCERPIVHSFIHSSICLVVGHLAAASAVPLELGCNDYHSVRQGSILLQKKENTVLNSDASRTLLEASRSVAFQNNESSPEEGVWCHDGLPNPRANWIVTFCAILLCITCVIGLLGTMVWLSKTLPKCKSPGFPLEDGAARCDALDGFRVIFTVHIICMHHGYAFGHTDFWFLGPEEVQMFFIMAGFVQTMVDYGRRPQYGGQDVAVHIARRLARLAPPYYAVILWEAVIAKTYAIPDIDYYMPWTLNSLFLQAIISPQKFCQATPTCPGNYNTYSIPWRSGHIWFASAMMFMGLLHPVFYNLLRRCGLLVHCVMLAATICFSVHYDNQSWYYWAPGRMPQYIIGMLGALIASQIRSKYREGLAEHGLNWGRLFDACFLVTLAFSTVIRYAFSDSPNSRMWMAKDGQFLSGWTLLLVAGFCMTPGSSVLAELLSAQPLQRLATYAYGAYLFQFGTQYIIPLWPKEGFCDSFLSGRIPQPLLRFLLVCCLPWALAVLSFHCLERPVHRGVENMLRSSGT